MSEHTKKIVALVDELANKCEENGEFGVAAELDTISMLVVTANTEVTPGVSRLADTLQKHFPRLDTERALHTARALYAKHESPVKDDEADEDEAEEKEGDGTGAGGILPLNGYGAKEKRQGPRPEDVPIGTAEWWK